METSLNLLEEINSISKIHTLHREDIDNIMIEFAQRIISVFKIERMSVWLFNPEKDAMVSMGEYDLRTRKFSKDNTLLKKNFPTYFKAISENEIILAENILTNALTKELNIEYSVPNDIISLMDIPLRLAGELIGAMCFEKTGDKERIFSKNEQVFAISISLVFASNLEARHRRILQFKLDQELKEKEILIKEIHHQVKNNLSVVSSLINLQANRAKDSFHKALFGECRNKINTISGIHEIIYKSDSFSEINLKDYFSKLISNLKSFYSTTEKNIELDYDIDSISLEIAHALHLALIINEAITNCYKHAFSETNSGKINVSITSENEQLVLIIKDNGKGLKKPISKSDSLGMDIINGLAEQLDATYNFENQAGAIFTLRFNLIKSDD